MSEVLQIALTFLVFTTIITLSVLTGFLIKLIVDLSNLTKNLNETTSIVKFELKPLLTEFKELLKSVSSITTSADKQVNKISDIFKLFTNPSSLLVGKAQNSIRSVLKGAITGIRVFLNSKKK